MEWTVLWKITIKWVKKWKRKHGFELNNFKAHEENKKILNSICQIITIKTIKQT